MAEDPRYRLVYDESIRSLSDQQSALDELRSRAGILLSAASISTSFLGGLAARRGHLGILGWAAVASFVATALLICFVLLPTKWTFHVDVGKLLADYIETDPPADVDEMRRSLAFYRHRRFVRNERRIRRLFLAFRYASVLLILEVLAWLLDFAVR